jgi:hypothetical protein
MLPKPCYEKGAMTSLTIALLALCLICVPGVEGEGGKKAKKTESRKPAKTALEKEGKKQEGKDEESPDSPFKVFPDPNGHAYFPRGREGWYTKPLSVMKEISLQPKEKETNGWSFRFTWLRTFHHPIAVRLWKQGDEIQMRAVRLNGMSGYDPGKIDKEITHKITAEQWKQVQPLIEDKDLWKPLTDEEEMCVGTDGSRWLFERCAGQTWTMSNFYCPKDLTPEGIKKMGLDPAKFRNFAKVTELGLLLVKMAELMPADDEVY